MTDARRSSRYAVGNRIGRTVLLVFAVAAIGLIDYLSGPHIAFSLFYLLPVIAAAWLEGAAAACIVAAAAGIAWFIADVVDHEYSVAISLWNAFTRLTIFVTIGLILSRLDKERAQLSKANEELEAFTYSVSHDLRSPLIHIGQFASMLEGRLTAQLDDVARRHLGAISESSAIALKLIDDLLEFSRLGRTALRRQRVDLRELVEDVRESVANGETGRLIRWQVEPLGSVTGDPSMLRIVMHNLLANAVKYTRPRAEAVIEIGSRPENGEVVVWVRDNGVGFDDRYVDKLFGVFERLHGPQEFEGTGIGLAIVHRIVARHGGRVSAAGQVGHGATFYFTLPETTS